MNKIQEVIKQKDWKFLISNYSTKDICLSLNFSEAMHVVEDLFYYDFCDDDNQQYALKLAFEIKDHFKDKWNSDWKNEIFLGELCVTLWLYDEWYLCYKRAYDKLKDPPERLLLLLSSCNFAPTPPITDEESEFYLRKALEKKLTCETALAMRSFYRIKEDKSQEQYWDQVYIKLEKDNVHSEDIIPDVFKQKS